jgi:hypothetical protein
MKISNKFFNFASEFKNGKSGISYTWKLKFRIIRYLVLIWPHTKIFPDRSRFLAKWAKFGQKQLKWYFIQNDSWAKSPHSGKNNLEISSTFNSNPDFCSKNFRFLLSNDMQSNKLSMWNKNWLLRIDCWIIQKNCPCVTNIDWYRPIIYCSSRTNCPCEMNIDRTPYWSNLDLQKFELTVIDKICPSLSNSESESNNWRLLLTTEFDCGGQKLVWGCQISKFCVCSFVSGP